MYLDNQPKKSREETKEAIENLIHGPRPVSIGPLLVSDIPRSLRTNSSSNNNNQCESVIMGIDEAGRGPVLGPMIYAGAYWKEGTAIPKGYNDSKQMTSDQRDKLLDATLINEDIGFVIRVLHATEISQNMLRKSNPYNLNAQSHDAAIQIIQCVLDAGVQISKCYVDTVGREETYKAKLDKVFDGSGINFVVEKKADAKYLQCSAASILAKVTRDRIVEHWKFTEPQDSNPDLDYGSGYPSDPKCKAWMERNFQDKVFCYPDIVRFSWGPVKDACKDKGVKVGWEADEQDESQGTILDFVSSNKQLTKRPRLAYFETHKLRRVAKLTSR